MQICDDDNESNEKRIAKVKEGIRFLLTHFEGRQPLFPRKMSTALSQGRQFTVYSEEQILNECIKANFIDCRLNAYPVSDDNNISIGIQAPNIILIDLDLSKNENEDDALLRLNKITSNILNTIGNKLQGGCKPTVLWTGNGYHIYIVLDTRRLELITELAELSKQPSEEFLKFVEIKFSNYKSDSKHNPSFKSYLLRIPHTFNSKCITKGVDAGVKIIHRFDALRTLQIDACLIREFRVNLVDLDIKNKTAPANREAHENTSNRYCQWTTHRISQSYIWIEKLLHLPIADHRKYTIELVTAPYLINIKH